MVELLKDYDCNILYHLDKDNMVADALSQKSMGKLAHVLVKRRSLVQGMHELGDMAI